MFEIADETIKNITEFIKLQLCNRPILSQSSHRAKNELGQIFTLPCPITGGSITDFSIFPPTSIYHYPTPNLMKFWKIEPPTQKINLKLYYTNKGSQVSLSKISRVSKAILPQKDKNVTFWLALLILLNIYFNACD